MRWLKAEQGSSGGLVGGKMVHCKAGPVKA